MHFQRFNRTPHLKSEDRMSERATSTAAHRFSSLTGKRNLHGLLSASDFAVALMSVPFLCVQRIVLE